MGQKVHPTIFRIGNIYTWHSRWYAGKRSFPGLLKEDQEIRLLLRTLLRDAAVASIDIERSANAVTVVIASAKPGFIIGRAGTGAEELKERLRKTFFAGRKVSLNLNIIEVERPALSSPIIMQTMVNDLEKRLPFRRILKMTADKVLKAGAKGVKLRVSGRLNGSEIARSEAVSHGSIPLHNLRADIDYAQGFARTIFGTIGVKVWIYRGEIFDTRKKEKEQKEDKEEEAAKI